MQLGVKLVHNGVVILVEFQTVQSLKLMILYFEATLEACYWLKHTAMG
jgi:hypothetical protein